VIVVDTNVIAYLLLPGVHTEAARAVIATDSEWAAPLLWRSEFRNVLATYLRQRHLTVAEALELQTAGEDLLTGREYSIDSEAVLKLAASSRRSAYDCEFVALAHALGVPLVTSDQQVLTSFPETAIALTSFGEGRRKH
jgi:predicted nucleic acid-binding protein